MVKFQLAFVDAATYHVHKISCHVLHCHRKSVQVMKKLLITFHLWGFVFNSTELSSYQRTHSVEFKYVACNFLVPVGDAVTSTEYLHVGAFRAGQLSIA